jgi:hypothetical protein
MKIFANLANVTFQLRPFQGREKFSLTWGFTPGYNLLPFQGSVKVLLSCFHGIKVPIPGTSKNVGKDKL